jgi:putative hemolysin
MSVFVAFVVILILLGVNALLAFSEAAILNARKSSLRERADNGDRAAIRLLQLLESPSQLLATIQVGAVLVGYAAAAVGAYCLVGPLRDRIDGSSIGLVADNAGVVAFLIVIAALSVFSIVFDELLPRQIAIARADSLAAMVVGPILTLAVLLRPLVRALIAITNAILRLFGNPAAATLPHITHAEIMALVESAADEGLVEEGQADLVEDALSFGETFVRNVMIPRVDVESVEGETTMRDAVDIFFRTGFSRLPVYHDTPDDVLGILHVKDTFRLTWSEPDSAEKPVSGFLRPAYFVPETKPIDELLLEFRERRTHVAVVVDEYGGMAGLVTLEDVLEELVGEIADEFDPGYEPYREIEPGVYEVDGRISLNDLADLLDFDRDDLSTEDVESVGGLIAERLGRMPEAGDVAEDGPLRFEVRAMTGYRVALARVELLPPVTDDFLDAPLLEEP